MGAGAASNQGCCELPEVKVAPRDLASNTDEAKRLLDEINGQVKKMKRYVAEQVRALEEGKDYRRAIRAKMRKKRTRDDGSPLSGIVRLLRGLPARGRRAHRPPAVLQRGVPARALARGARAQVPVRTRKNNSFLMNRARGTPSP